MTVVSACGFMVQRVCLVSSWWKNTISVLVFLSTMIYVASRDDETMLSMEISILVATLSKKFPTFIITAWKCSTGRFCTAKYKNKYPIAEKLLWGILINTKPRHSFMKKKNLKCSHIYFVALHFLAFKIFCVSWSFMRKRNYV